jgi:GTP-binding protein
LVPASAEHGAARYRRAAFVTGAAQLWQLPADEGWEVAFSGRSNVGKSSALNALAERNGLARVSKTPGRTQQINVFSLGEGRRLMDLPGYGYAKVPDAVRQQWAKMLEGYFRHRRSLRGVVLLMDIRHPMTDFDAQMLTWCAATHTPLIVLLTKSDKLSRSQALRTIAQVRLAVTQQLADSDAEVSVEAFSSLKRQGVEPLRAQLDKWFQWE